MKHSLKRELCCLLAIGGVFFLILYFVKHEDRETPKVIFIERDTPDVSSSHQLIVDALIEPEAALPSDSDLFKERESLVLPVAGSTLPEAWDSEPAPNVTVDQLSPSFQRSMAVSEPLSRPEYVDPSSGLNLGRVEELRAIRQKRLSDAGVTFSENMSDPVDWFKARQKEIAR